MTDEREMANGQTASGVDSVDVGPVQAPPISRRTLIRGASVAVPTILTLNSNAAMGWAIGSNTIGTRLPDGDNIGGVHCLNTPELQLVKTAPDGTGVYALGDPAYGEVFYVPAEAEGVKFKRLVSGDYVAATPQDVCVNGGAVKYKAGSGGFVNLSTPADPMPARALVSVAAVASFGTRIVPRSYTEL